MHNRNPEKRSISKLMLQQYRQYLIDNEKSSATISKYVHDVMHFTQYAAESSIDKQLVLQYKGDLVNDYAVTSANSMLAAINSFFKFAGWHDCCVKQFRIQKKVYCSAERELSRIEYQRLVRAAQKKGDRRLALIIETLCCTGIRVSELQHITVEALHTGEVTVSCKGNRRPVLLIRKLCRKLLKYARSTGVSSGPVFVTCRGMALDRHSIWRQMKKLCNEAGVAAAKVFPHNLRHLFARTFYELEKDIVKLADILGHSSIDTTRIYMISAGAEHRRKLEAMHLVL